MAEQRIQMIQLEWNMALHGRQPLPPSRDERCEPVHGDCCVIDCITSEPVLS